MTTSAELRRLADEIEQQERVAARAKLDGAVLAICWMMEHERRAKASRITKALTHPWRDRSVVKRLKDMGFAVELLLPSSEAKPSPATEGNLQA
ncbi:MAG: hypothetical protein RIR25_1086 [Verrucomicrobiota bacterium]|jgi:hypothetical protein